MSNIVLNTKTYLGRGIANGVASWAEISGGIAAAFSVLTSSLRIDSKVRGTWKLELPTVAEEASACACPGVVLSVCDATISFRMDTNADTATRTDFADRLEDLVASPEFRASIISLQQPTG